MFLHPVNNIEHNIKQNIDTGTEVIALIPPWYHGDNDTVCKKQEEWKCTDKWYKKPINKIYSFNDIVILC